MVDVNGQVLNALMIEHDINSSWICCIASIGDAFGAFSELSIFLLQSHTTKSFSPAPASATPETSQPTAPQVGLSVSYSCKLLIRSCLLHPFAFVVHSIAKMHVDICRSCLAPSGRNPQCTCCRHPSELQPWTSRWYRHPSQVDK